MNELGGNSEIHLCGREIITGSTPGFASFLFGSWGRRFLFALSDAREESLLAEWHRGAGRSFALIARIFQSVLFKLFGTFGDSFGHQGGQGGVDATGVAGSGK